MSEQQTFPGRLPNGDIDIRRIGVPGDGWRDVYYYVLRQPWRVFYALLAAIYLLTNCAFATLYWLQPGCIAEPRPGYWLEDFFFSFETIATVGFGVQHPVTLYAHWLVVAEILFSVMFVPLATGLVIVKFARPTARVTFSRHAVIETLDGIPTLMFRLANLRDNQIFEAHISLTLLRTERTPDGRAFRRLVDLVPVRTSNPMFMLSWSVLHRIDASSPLFGVGFQDVRVNDLVILAVMTGLDATTSATVHARHSYDASDFLIDHRFDDIVDQDEAGRFRIDYRRIHNVTKLATAGLITLALSALSPTHAATPDGRQLAATLCPALAAAVDAAAPSGPVFAASYPTATTPALRGTAFVYDNAVAAIALLACHDRPHAARILAALRIAATHDRFWHDGRIRNAYRAGPVTQGAPPALPGWWDAPAQRWDEDGYAVGTATGNVAWAALALLAAGDQTTAASLMHWIASHTAAGAPFGGYRGGFYGEEPAPTPLVWQSTEQNTDAAAAFTRLADPAAATAHRFVTAMWDAPSGHFWIGTDGTSLNRTDSGIDAELWPLIAPPPAAPSWSPARSWVRHHMATAGGFGFTAPPAGLWTEGTAQAALILPDDRLFATLLAQRAPDGLLYATPAARLPTGLALTPTSTSADFVYLHLPHLGATAWAVLAATHTNPFVAP